MILIGRFKDVQGNLLIVWDPQPSTPSDSPEVPPPITTSDAEVIFCYKCGGENSIKQKFCGHCGERLIDSPTI
ncbi:MAG TPA: hypothetical protein VMX17_10435 [Candidatus Glassbacteria bacterium]|nr:hypothetical protein [Candidatus Glassbacteria bacterium]